MTQRPVTQLFGLDLAMLATSCVRQCRFHIEDAGEKDGILLMVMIRLEHKLVPVVGI
jgi:hypothetical protein